MYSHMCACSSDIVGEGNNKDCSHKPEHQQNAYKIISHKYIYTKNSSYNTFSVVLFFYLWQNRIFVMQRTLCSIIVPSPNHPMYIKQVICLSHCPYVLVITRPGGMLLCYKHSALGPHAYNINNTPCHR